VHSMARQAKESPIRIAASQDDSSSETSSSSSGSSDDDTSAKQKGRNGHSQDREVLRWLDEALQKERRAMSLHVQRALELRHRALLKELGPKLSGAQSFQEALSTSEVKGKVGRRLADEIGRLEPIPEEALSCSEGDAPHSAVVQKRGHDSSDVIVASRQSGTFLATLSKSNVSLGQETSWCARFSNMVDGPMYEILFGTVIVVNAVIMALEMQYRGFDSGRATAYPGYKLYAVERWPWASECFIICEWILGITFTIELLLKIAAQRKQFVNDMWNLLDCLIVGAWLLQTILQADIGINPTLLRLVRLLRLLRLLRALRTIVVFDPLYLMITAIRHSFSLMVWSLLVLILVQMCLAILLQTLVEDYIRDPINMNTLEVYKYFGSFSRTMLTMFEMTLGNWMVPCRALVENVSEWYSLFFLVHKFVIGFSVVSIITAVFIQETFKVAGSDDTIMLKNQERSMKLHERKMTELFKHADEDGNGSLDRAEFMEVLDEPVVRNWLASMGLHVEDAGLVFDLLEGGSSSQEVTASELVKGAARLKGVARHIDLVALAIDNRQNNDLLKQLSEQLLMVGLEEDETPTGPPSQISPNVSLQDPSVGSQKKKVVNLDAMDV